MTLIHVYRNREDDQRGPNDLHFCINCKGWYGVPHEGQHCETAEQRYSWTPECACRFCRQHFDLPIEGQFGFFTRAKAWQPSTRKAPQ